MNTPKTLKVYTVYTDSHADLFDTYFAPSLKNTDLELHSTRIYQTGKGEY
jgi:hypothetical protein